MNTPQAGFALRGRNPDVLTCIANLSNDEVFTPPEFANKMLDTIAEAWAANYGGKNIWADPNVTFLDPFTKSGVFLREITKRLTDGLADEIPDLRERVDRILTKQVFGIGITYLTSLLARRSVYCSKFADGPHSIATSFSAPAGNIWFERMEHTWVGSTEFIYTADAEGNQVKKYTNGKCSFCGAPRAIFDREPGLENHAYAVIHAADPKVLTANIFGGEMKFDVVVGNPPYQMTGGAGGTSDSSIYHLFVQQAIGLEPRFVSMVIPSRWMAGGRGLDNFRKAMLNDGHLRNLVDYIDTGDAFPGVQIKGGICYFLWDASHNGSCNVERVADGVSHFQKGRNLGEFDIFIRDEQGLGILRKVLAKDEPPVIDLVSGDTPFGIATNFADWSDTASDGTIDLHLIHKGRRTVGNVARALIRKNADAIDTWKVFVPKAYGAGETFPHQILGKEIVAAPPSVCSQSYMTIGPFSTEIEAQSFASYYRTRFFRFLVSLRKITQDALRSTYSWVPQQSWDRTWTDTELYEKYGITEDEVAFIDSMIRPMETTDDNSGE